jgi:hypothetical protein
MKPEQQVTNLELSRRLKELGVKQNGLFTHYKIFKGPETGFEEEWRIAYGNIKDLETVSAFTVAELGEIMKGKGMGVTAHSSLIKDEWWVRGGEWIVEKQQYSHLETDERWADCLAKMLIYLLENKLITIEQA